MCIQSFTQQRIARSLAAACFPRLIHYNAMNSRYCNVALAVPLRTLFTYAIPEIATDAAQPGSRVLVPFRNKSMVGLVVELLDEPPASVQPGVKIRALTKVLDETPALTPKLLELAQWIAGYYLAPIGEVLRGMLPPVTDVRMLREVLLTPAGRDAIAQWKLDENAPQNLSECTGEETTFLSRLAEKKGLLAFAAALKSGISADRIQKLQRRGFVEMRERVAGSARRTHRVIAWKGAAVD